MERVSRQVVEEEEEERRPTGATDLPLSNVKYGGRRRDNAHVSKYFHVKGETHCFQWEERAKSRIRHSQKMPEDARRMPKFLDLRFGRKLSNGKMEDVN
ncbi:hypothetical protein RUM44_010216 [Polyplax serrata]|uniref:Uncharacterized protein n=1 Tax=Polyplax serrata TaxID=468196 RepID=A0ABR1AWP2_POLSC